MNSTLAFLFLMVWSSTASFFTNETIAKVKELGKYCNFPRNLKARPKLYEHGWWCTIEVKCIPMSQICDGKLDCEDYTESDEKMACQLYPDTGKK